MNHPWRIFLVLLTVVGLLAGQAHCASADGDHKAEATAEAASHCAVHCVCQVLPEVAVPIVVASPLQSETTQIIPFKELVSSPVVRPFFQPPRA